MERPEISKKKTKEPLTPLARIILTSDPETSRDEENMLSTDLLEQEVKDPLSDLDHVLPNSIPLSSIQFNIKNIVLQKQTTKSETAA